ncbi:MAG: TrmH family RNA methyltransferase, partial [Peptostreptococcaceae bacterium]|nr:TrmH family RNA methyltransferase [Peptostreptococcaceae bacterium]
RHRLVRYPVPVHAGDKKVLLAAHSDVKYVDNSFIVFGKETKGLPESLIKVNLETCIRIPMLNIEKARSLNLSNSVAIVVYEALRQLDYPGMR